MNIKLTTIFLAFVYVFFTSCDDDTVEPQPFVVAFEDPSVNLSDSDSEEVDIQLVFSRTATEEGSVAISYSVTNAEYGTDFTTSPDGSAGSFMVDISAGTESASFSFNKLLNALEGTEKSVSFSIDEVMHTEGTAGGTTTTVVNFMESPSLGSSVDPEVGGSTQGNQVFIDLSAQQTTVSERESWELGFYSGDEFRVAINGSIYMAAGATEFTDIDAVTEEDVSDLQGVVQVGFGYGDNSAYVDSPDGDIMGTAIAEISGTDSENHVYLLNMGAEVPSEAAEPGSANVAGDPRGWKKIRILRNGDDYLLQYADLDSDTHEEVTISKTQGYRFTFYSITNEEVTTVEPETPQWDIAFTVFTNVINNPSDGTNIAYGYSDFVMTNREGGVAAYAVETDSFAYQDFGAENIEESEFDTDQRSIGSDWRDVFSGSVNDDLFFVLKDPEGNYYKLRFTALVNAEGERGHPSFEYSLL